MVTNERDKRLCNGVYIKGQIEGIPILFTADTGASRTVISERVYDRMEEGHRPSLEKTSCLVGAGGSPIRERGKAMFNLQLGPLGMAREGCRVAAIEDDALLGYDVLVGGENGPADILLSKGKIVLDSIEIPCIQVGSKSRARKVVIADDVSVPGNSEALIDVFIERMEEDDLNQKADYLVEPTNHFKESYHLLMAATLVDINKTTTCKLRLLTPFSSEVVLRQDAEVALPRW